MRTVRATRLAVSDEMMTTISNTRVEQAPDRVLAFPHPHTMTIEQPRAVRYVSEMCSGSMWFHEMPLGEDIFLGRCHFVPAA